jgi:hypothetical protein
MDSLIFGHCNSFNASKQTDNKIKEDKCQNKLTPEILQNIQTNLDNMQTIRSISKKTGVSESAIRKAIKSGKLIRK